MNGLMKVADGSFVDKKGPNPFANALESTVNKPMNQSLHDAISKLRLSPASAPSNPSFLVRNKKPILAAAILAGLGAGGYGAYRGLKKKEK